MHSSLPRGRQELNPELVLTCFMSVVMTGNVTIPPLITDASHVLRKTSSRDISNLLVRTSRSSACVRVGETCGCQNGTTTGVRVERLLLLDT